MKSGMTYKDLAGSDTVESITLVAKWSPKSFTVRYDTGGGSAVTDRENILWTDSPITTESESTLIGYQLTGWYYGEVLVTDSDTLGDILEDDSTQEITLTADWEERIYTVHYDTDGGNSIFDKTGVRYSDEGLLPAKSTYKAGHTFSGWYYGDKAVTDGTEDTEGTKCSELLGDAADSMTELTLTAHWTVNGGYAVEYDTVGGGYLPDKTNVKWTDTGLLPGTRYRHRPVSYTHLSAERDDFGNGLRFPIA